MLKIIKNESGSAMIGAAIVIALVAVASSWNLLGMISNSSMQLHYDHDAVQEELFLRSESDRILIAIENNSNPPDRGGNELRIVDKAANRDTQYKIVTKREYDVGGGDKYKSLITATHPKIGGRNYDSPVERMTEKEHDKTTLDQWQYFTFSEKSENSDLQDDIVKFWGQDEISGPLHSNDDIWIQNLNPSWPRFYGPVTTAGRIRVWPSGDLAINAAPMDQIFLYDGIDKPPYQEEVLPLIYNPQALDLRRNSQHIGIGVDIVYAKMEGGVINTKFGTIIGDGVQDFDVYSWYPHNDDSAVDVINNGGNWFEDSDIIWTNEIAMFDTVWTTGPSLPISQYGNAYFFPDSELWVEGVVSGRVTLGCANRIYITDNIWYANTTMGAPPDDEQNFNLNDVFGLVSEEKIMIRYKHRDPFLDNIIRDGNCSDVYLYGAYAAIGQGDPDLYGVFNCHYEGIITFEYQHGHGSTPSFWSISPYTMDDTLYTYIDFHKFLFPINEYVPPNILGFNLHGNLPPYYPATDPPCGYPYEDPAYSFPNNQPYSYPYGTDYPWYNPVWPESEEDIVWERGTIHRWGSFAQTRRGFIHRSGTDPLNHPNNQWELDEFTFHYDGYHPSCGYGKDYYFDIRFKEPYNMSPPYFPDVVQEQGELGLALIKSKSWGFYSPRDW